jgi:hypothetical protein
MSSDDITQPSISVPMSAVAIAMPRISVEPSNLDFGAVAIGRPVQLSLTLRNIGKLDLAISTMRCTEPAFTVVGDPAFALPAGASKTLAIQCSPKNPGQRRATLSINSNDVNQPTLSVPMTAMMVTVVRIAVEPTSLDFASVSVGQSAQRTLSVRNTGTIALSVSAMRSSLAAFAVVGDTAFRLAPEGSKALTVQFTPTVAGQVQANLTIHSDDPSLPALGVPLLGTAVGVPHISAEPLSVDFGALSIGQSASRTLTVRSTGTAELAVSKLTISEPAFSTVGATAFQLAPGAARGITITFKPSAAGQTQANLTISCNDSDHAELAVVLSGSARMPHILRATAPTRPLSFPASAAPNLLSPSSAPRPFSWRPAHPEPSRSNVRPRTLDRGAPPSALAPTTLPSRPSPCPCRPSPSACHASLWSQPAWTLAR